VGLTLLAAAFAGGDGGVMLELARHLTETHSLHHPELTLWNEQAYVTQCKVSVQGLLRLKSADTDRIQVHILNSAAVAACWTPTHEICASNRTCCDTATQYTGLSATSKVQWKLADARDHMR
jgi:hypothetical protein